MNKGKRRGAPPGGQRQNVNARHRHVNHSWLYGLHAVKAALANPKRRFHRLMTVGNVAESLGPTPIRPEIVGRDDLEGLLPKGVVHQGIALLAEPLPEPNIEDAARPDPASRNIVIVLDQVTDPHNVGAILRSAAAFGVRAVIATERNTPESTATLAKAASGALDIVPLVRVVNLARALEDLKRLGYWCAGLADKAEKTLADADLTGNVAIVVGAEGEGLRRLTIERCDQLIRIPTASAMASLNVSNAAAVALYELVRNGKS